MKFLTQRFPRNILPFGLSKHGASKSVNPNLFPYFGESVEHDDSYPKLLFKWHLDNDLFWILVSSTNALWISKSSIRSIIESILLDIKMIDLNLYLNFILETYLSFEDNSNLNFTKSWLWFNCIWLNWAVKLSNAFKLSKLFELSSLFRNL